MTREEALAVYHPIRASVRRILSAAISACNQADLMRAAKQLGLWADGKIVLPEDDEAAEMLADVALFEPNQRGRRAFDTFLGGKALNSRLAISNWPDERATRSFPCFDSARATRSPVFGSKTFWPAIGGSGSWTRAWRRPLRRMSLSVRVFDAGEFHVGFGIAAPSDDETTEFSVEGVARNGRTPFPPGMSRSLLKMEERRCSP